MFKLDIRSNGYYVDLIRNQLCFVKKNTFELKCVFYPEIWSGCKSTGSLGCGQRAAAELSFGDLCRSKYP